MVHFALLRIVGTECRLHEVAASKYTQTAMLWPTLDRHVLRALTDEHRGVVADYVDGVEGDAKTRYDRVDSKLRTLLGVNGLAFSLITGFSLGGKPLFLLASGPFIVSAILALRALGVHTFQVPSLTAQEVGAELTALHAIRLQGRLSAANENACVVDFIVDCFRAAHRYFVVALIMLPLLYLGWSLKYGAIAGNNPWQATGLEWQIQSPPLTENFIEVPVVDHEAYDYEWLAHKTEQEVTTVG